MPDGIELVPGAVSEMVAEHAKPIPILAPAGHVIVSVVVRRVIVRAKFPLLAK